MAAVEAYIATHPDAAIRVRQYQEQRRALRSALQPKYDEPIPVRLRVATIQAERRRRWRRTLGRVAAAGLWLLIGAAGGWFANEELAAGPSARIASAPVKTGIALRPWLPTASLWRRSGIRSKSMSARKSTFRVAVQAPWTPLHVPNLSAQGYRLMGGRLLPASAGPAAQLMYDDGTGRRLTVYLTGENGGETSFRYVRDGIWAASTGAMTV